MLEKTLQDFWFTEKQAKIYLVCLELGNAPASSIARKTWENRITTYSALKDMCKRWIAYELIKNEVRYYTVISPKELVITEKKKYEKINWALPELMALALTWNADRSKVYYYEWIDWIKELYEDQLSSTTWKYWFFWGNEAPKILQEYRTEYFTPKRAEKKIFSKRIVSNWVYNRVHVNTNKSGHRETLIINDPKFNLYSDISLYNWNKVSICTYPSESEISWIVIENKHLHDSLLNIFNALREANSKK